MNEEGWNVWTSSMYGTEEISVNFSSKLNKKKFLVEEGVGF
jgi:hypothetical protein